MKNIYTLHFIALLVTTFIINDTSAQSFVLKYNNQVIPNGDTIVVSGDTSAILMAQVDVENIGAANKTVDVSKTILDQPVGVGYFVWDVMYDSSATNSMGLLINAGATASNFVAYYQSFGVAGTAFYRYTFFDENNPNDSASVVVEFNVYDYTGVPENTFTDFSLYPNPGSGRFLLTFAVPSRNEIVAEVFTGTGLLISTEKISAGTLQQEFNLEQYPSGIYFLKIPGYYSRAAKISIIH